MSIITFHRISYVQRYTNVSPNAIESRWIHWRTELFQLRDLKTERCLKPKDFSEFVSTDLYHFSNASFQGYGQGTFLRKARTLCSDNRKDSYWNEAQRFHVFVANRVQQICDHMSPSQWKYVPTPDNLADAASRSR